MTMLAWMMKSTRGSDGLTKTGLSPSKRPACDDTLAAVAAGAAAAVVVDMACDE
jgi:hypothetical protein